MKKWLNLILRIIKDEMGIAPLVGLGIGAMLGGGLMSAFGGEDEEEYDPYSSLRKSYLSYASGKLGSKTPYSYNPAFEIPKPAIETQTENVISGKLGNLPKSADYKSRVESAKTQQISREKERAGIQREEEKNMYNRLGLVSSTPWLNREGELGEESLSRQKDIETGMDIYGLDYGLKADQLAEDIANTYLTQGQTLGSAQRGYSQYPIGMSMQDLIRQSNEEQAYAQMISSFLAQNAPERTVTPDFLSQMGGTLTNIGSLGLMSGILGGAGKSTIRPKLTTV